MHPVSSKGWGNPMTYRILDWKIHNASRELKHSNTVWFYNRINHFFHTPFPSHYVLDNTIWSLLLYSHTGLDCLWAEPAWQYWGLGLSKCDEDKVILSCLPRQTWLYQNSRSVVIIYGFIISFSGYNHQVLFALKG